MSRYTDFLLDTALQAHQSGRDYQAETILRMMIGCCGKDAHAIYFLGHLHYLRGELDSAAWLLTPHNWLLLPAVIVGGLLLLGLWIVDNLELALLFSSWIFLALFLFLPINTPWLVMLPLALSLASSSRRTALLAHLLAAGALVAYGLDYWPGRWDSQALVTIGLAALVWGWTLFLITTWQMTHQDDEEEQPVRRRLSLSRPSWPSRPAAWPSSRSGLRRP